jgi:beta-phosphoglucomutase-like phosphatase (HAD superfamily)
VIRALLWDVDGTLAETERDGHRVAFNRAFADSGVPWRWDERHYGELLRITGGRERLVHDMQRAKRAPDEPAAREALAATLHRRKNAHYQGIVQDGHVHLRAGVAELLGDCARAGVLLGIVTTTSRGNVEALLGHHLGRDWSARFATVVCAEQAPRKKPDPQAYAAALQGLGLPASATLAIEDSPAGVEAAQRAGVPVIVTPSYYFPACPPDVLACGPSLGSRDGWVPPAQAGTTRIDLKQLERWHQQRAATPPGDLALTR